MPLEKVLAVQSGWCLYQLSGAAAWKCLSRETLLGRQPRVLLLLLLVVVGGGNSGSSSSGSGRVLVVRDVRQLKVDVAHGAAQLALYVVMVFDDGAGRAAAAAAAGPAATAAARDPADMHTS